MRLTTGEVRRILEEGVSCGGGDCGRKVEALACDLIEVRGLLESPAPEGHRVENREVAQLSWEVAEGRHLLHLMRRYLGVVGKSSALEGLREELKQAQTSVDKGALLGLCVSIRRELATLKERMEEVERLLAPSESALR